MVATNHSIFVPIRIFFLLSDRANSVLQCFSVHTFLCFTLSAKFHFIVILFIKNPAYGLPNSINLPS